jgi:hypothetical protein
MNDDSPTSTFTGSSETGSTKRVGIVSSIDKVAV